MGCRWKQSVGLTLTHFFFFLPHFASPSHMLMEVFFPPSSVFKAHFYTTSAPADWAACRMAGREVRVTSRTQLWGQTLWQGDNGLSCSQIVQVLPGHEKIVGRSVCFQGLYEICIFVIKSAGSKGTIISHLANCLNWIRVIMMGEFAFHVSHACEKRFAWTRSSLYQICVISCIINSRRTIFE